MGTSMGTLARIRPMRGSEDLFINPVRTSGPDFLSENPGGRGK